MATKKVITEYNDGWKAVAGEGGQVELVQEPEPGDLAAAALPPVIGEMLLVPLENIQANPYQPRSAEDPETVARMAVDIYRRGLMQIPEARAVNGHYQLAFGHTRRAAFELLAGAGVPEAGIAPDGRFAEMPLHIRELDDRQMFERAVSENLKRRGLNAIEQAEAMRRYMAEFQASSRQAAELFGISDATVRGTVRLLKLPEPVQKQIAAGEITQGVARKLLSVARIIPGEVTDIGDQVAKGGDPDHLIGYRLVMDKNVVTLWESWRKADEPRAGAGLWLLTDEFPPENLPELTAKQLAELPGMGTGPAMEPLPKTRVKYYLDTLAADADPGLAARLVDENPDDADVIERIALLLRPPACSGCPFHVVSGGAHYCGLKACHTRKFKAYAQTELKRVSDEMGILIYDPDRDGKTVMGLDESGWSDDFRKASDLVKQKSPDLRLKQHHVDRAHMWTKNHCARIVLVGEAAERYIDERKSAAEQRKAHQEEVHSGWQRQRLNRDASRKFCEECSLPAIFASAFNGLDNIAVLCALTESEMPESKAKKATILTQLRIDLAADVLDREIYPVEDDGPVATAKHLKKVATTWGIALPADLVEAAKKYEVGEGVSTETENE